MVGVNQVTIYVFYNIFAHIHPIVLIYLPKCCWFNMPPNGIFYLLYMLFDYDQLDKPEEQKANVSEHKVC